MVLAAPLTAAVMASLATLVPAAPVSCCSPPGLAQQEKIRDQYAETWGGNYSLINSTFIPSFHMYQDRFPNANGSSLVPISTSEDFKQFVITARQGWAKYDFEVINSAFDGYKVVLRWQLHAIMGEGYPQPTTLKQGEPLIYNGTDFLLLDECTGLIKEVDSAQDSITFAHNLGETTIHV